MAKKTKAAAAAERFRRRVEELLRDPDWLDEGVQLWLRKQLDHPNDYSFSERERAALDRICAASTLFEGWGGIAVKDLVPLAAQYAADFDYDDELFLKELSRTRPVRLRYGDMKQLVGLCRSAGVDMPRFAPQLELDAAA